MAVCFCQRLHSEPPKSAKDVGTVTGRCSSSVFDIGRSCQLCKQGARGGLLPVHDACRGPGLVPNASDRGADCVDITCLALSLSVFTLEEPNNSKRARTMTGKPVRVGALAAADIVKKTARGICQADGVDLVAIGSRSLEKAQEYVKQLDQFLPADCKALGSYDEVLDLPDLDAVYIPLPSAHHVEWVQKAAAKGLHILLEKPIAANMQDLEAICQACEKHNVQLMDGTMWTHNPRTRQMESIIRDVSKFGPVTHVNSTFTYNTDEQFQATNIRAFPEADPLGCLGDQGWYCTCASIWAFNCEMPEMVFAHPGATRNDRNVPMYLGATMIWPGTPRRRAVIACGFDQALTQTLEVFSPKASVYLRDFQIPFNEKKCYFTVTSNHQHGELQTTDLTQRDEIWVELPQPQETYMWEEFATIVRNMRDQGGKPDKRWMQLARMTQQTLLAVEMSANKGNACVRVADLTPV